MSGVIGAAMGFGDWPHAFFSRLLAISMLSALGEIEKGTPRKGDLIESND